MCGFETFYTEGPPVMQGPRGEDGTPSDVVEFGPTEHLVEVQTGVNEYNQLARITFITDEKRSIMVDTWNGDRDWVETKYYKAPRRETIIGLER